MEQFTFEQLPQAISLLHHKLDHIEQLLLERHTPMPTNAEEVLTVHQTADFLNIAVATVYSKVSRREIPVNKQGKRLYFYKTELIEWIKSGRKKTAIELDGEATQFLIEKHHKPTSF
ncbi:helix-turn-helix domain-containing protein [Mucilaginibacter robiniae]|uniref:Helix-turn-helix domain-containing protein n=1 Tax=Mucilaginibacter robiniae TaxID=2728022 RepID=A0A7L5E4G9_9SPHI|nr:helix-turn-helix domain-containing protein [Mucilaginibacter robiniae]QJD95723.1 helix-turn-helix domain-containing protein [Mucilaginibacter robiniae]